jgi:hypothetical protein
LSERRIGFAPIGLANMLNVGGAVQGFQTVKTTAAAVMWRRRWR